MPESNLDQYWPEGDVREVCIFTVLCAILQADPVLSSIPITWCIWDGTPGEANSPSSASLPWIRLTPVRSSMRQGTNVEWELLFRVKFEIATRGTSYRDLGNMVGYFQRALRNRAPYQGDTVINALRAAGASAYELTDAASSPIHSAAAAGQPSEPSPPATVDFVGVGYILFQSFIDSDV